ncbi:MAG: OmpH family outer membrane protein [Bacteroidota bacterium]
MKRLFIVVSVIIILLSSLTSFSQVKQKFGHIDSNELLTLMPERETAKTAIETHAKQLEDQLIAMQKELELKYNDYVEKQATYSDLVKKTKEEEITSMQKRMQDFQTTAQSDLQTKEMELLQPIIEKAKKAIEEVAKEKGYSYIFDIGSGALLYWPEDSDDILPLVKEKLGIK